MLTKGYAMFSTIRSRITYCELILDKGTGTAAGDPLELSAITCVYNQYRQDCGPLVVGSVKSNIGHLESS